MTMIRLRVAVFALLLTVVGTRDLAAETPLKPGDFVAVVGDSITEQKLYSLFIEDYLLMCQPAAQLRTTQFGWGGETSWGFAARMTNDMLRFKPTVVTTCFGMNDAGSFNPDQGARYRKCQREIVEECKKAGVRVVVVGSPGCVDSDTFQHDKGPAAAVAYNKLLEAERDISREVAQSEGVIFADVFSPMVDVMIKTKAKYGSQYPLAGKDGVHPDQNGHLVMAYAYLKALGCSGEIGKISLDLQTNKAEASEGHKVLSVDKGAVEIESSRYPFCFYGDPAQPSSTRGVIEFLPFNQELNRLTLVVKNAPGNRCKVTWGSASKEFNAADLSSGINLAAEFLDNPFSEPFQKVQAQVTAQQGYETPMVKKLITIVPQFQQLLPDASRDLERVAASAMRRDKTLVDQSLAAVVPVRHKITIEPLK